MSVVKQSPRIRTGDSPRAAYLARLPPFRCACYRNSVESHHEPDPGRVPAPLLGQPNPRMAVLLSFFLQG